MSDKNLTLTCIWRSDEFYVSDSKSLPSDDEAYLTIDENISRINVHIPNHFSLITKKIIERRVQSISKSGFLVPNSQIRIGRGFDVNISKAEEIPDVLLQEGHKYSLERPTPTIQPSSRPKVKAIDSDYTPSFLTHEPLESEADTHVSSESEPLTPAISEREPTISQEPLTEEKIEILDENLRDNESIAGRFLIELTKMGDVYITQKKDHYSAEYSAGRVDFRVQDGDIEILLTKRIPTNDQTLKNAISAATRKN